MGLDDQKGAMFISLPISILILPALAIVYCQTYVNKTMINANQDYFKMLVNKGEGCKVPKNP